MPVKNAYDEIIAVAQVINKNPDKDCGHFTVEDEKVSKISFQIVLIQLNNHLTLSKLRKLKMEFGRVTQFKLFSAYICEINIRLKEILLSLLSFRNFSVIFFRNLSFF